MSRTFAQPVLIRRTRSPVDAVGAAFRTAFRRVRREAQLRCDQRHLESMPDYILRDVGIHRSEVQAITRTGHPARRSNG